MARRRSVQEVMVDLPGLALMLGVGLAYLALAQYVLVLNDVVLLGAGFWPAAGLSLASLLLLPKRRWGWAIAGVAIAEFGGDLFHGYPLGGIVVWTIGNCVEPVVGALLIRRFAKGEGDLAPLSKLMRFLLFGVTAGPLVGATIGSLGTIIYFDSAVAQVWPKYVVGDALGVLVVAPALLAFRAQSNGRSPLERSVLVVSSLAITLLVFRNWDVSWDVTLPYLVVPFLIWGGLRFGVKGAAFIGFAVANVANWATATAYGPFALPGNTEHAITLLQVFLLITLTSSLVVAALASDLIDRHEAERVLALKNAELTGTLEELRESKLYLRKLEGILPICMHCRSVRTDDDKAWVPLDRYLMTSDAVSLSHTYCPECEEKGLAAVN